MSQYVFASIIFLASQILAAAIGYWVKSWLDKSRGWFPRRPAVPLAALLFDDGETLILVFSKRAKVFPLIVKKSHIWFVDIEAEEAIIQFDERFGQITALRGPVICAADGAVKGHIVLERSRKTSNRRYLADLDAGSEAKFVGLATLIE